MVMTVEKVIQSLESGCHPQEIAIDLRRGMEAAKGVGAGDPVLIAEQVVLLRSAFRALDALIVAKPMLAAFNFGENSLGNLRAELTQYRPLGKSSGLPETLETGVI